MRNVVFGPRSGGKRILPLSQSPGCQEMREVELVSLGLPSQCGVLQLTTGT